MEDVVTCMFVGVLALVAIPAVTWFVIKHLPKFIMFCSKVAALILFLIIIERIMSIM